MLPQEGAGAAAPRHTAQAGSSPQVLPWLQQRALMQARQAGSPGSIPQLGAPLPVVATKEPTVDVPAAPPTPLLSWTGVLEAQAAARAKGRTRKQEARTPRMAAR